MKEAPPGPLLYLYGGAEVVEAPGDDDVVVAAHQGSHHGGAVAHTTEAGVDLGQESRRLITIFLSPLSSLLASFSS